MGRYICKLDDRYFEWSTVVDAPVTYGMSREEFQEYYRNEYGRQCLSGLADRMKRVEEKGTSSLMHDSIEELVEGNRAGPQESEATMDELRAYIMPKAKP